VLVYVMKTLCMLFANSHVCLIHSGMQVLVCSTGLG